MNKLNSIIKIDLHIHSNASEYKDKDKVKNSTIDNLDILFNKLNENNIGLCAITDHNRFDYSLYKALKEKCKANDKSLKNNLPGIEFDVKMEESKEVCHIIAIFNDNDETKIKNIQQVLTDNVLLEQENDFYNKEIFEKILREIGLDVLLIAHQKKDVDYENKSNSDKHSKDFSNSVESVEDYIETGYISSFELNNAHQEGIVKNSLKRYELSIPLISGSDCHDWNLYPNDKKGFEFTSLKCLPTFKGLLLSFTSFESRINRNNLKTNFIKSFKVENEEVELSSGINAIIGDNGAGKSYILSKLNYLSNDKKYKEFEKENQFSMDFFNKDIDKPTITYIKQGQIIEDLNSGSLFPENNFKEVLELNSVKYEYNNFYANLFEYLKNNISYNNEHNLLKTLTIDVTYVEKKTYFPIVYSEINQINNEENIKRVSALQSILNSLDKEITSNYYNEESKKKLINAKEIINSVYENINEKCEYINKKNKIMNIIKKCLDDYNIVISPKRSKFDSENDKIKEERNSFVSIILKNIQNLRKPLIYPSFPDKFNGTSKNPIEGFEFIKTYEYHNKDLKNEFYECLFNANYQKEENIKKIKTEEEYVKALTGCKEFSKIYDIGNKNFTSFKEKNLEKSFQSIKEAGKDFDYGTTPGEICLAYFKYFVATNKEKNVLLIDQPEDDINPKRIASDLNKILVSIRDKVQVIIVTHNPLLVVNLDVDNLILVKKKHNKISMVYGALEYEDDSYSVIENIKDNLEGGDDAIIRRFKVYGKNHY